MTNEKLIRAESDQNETDADEEGGIGFDGYAGGPTLADVWKNAGL